MLHLEFRMRVGGSIFQVMVVAGVAVLVDIGEYSSFVVRSRICGTGFSFYQSTINFLWRFLIC